MTKRKPTFCDGFINSHLDKMCSVLVDKYTNANIIPDTEIFVTKSVLDAFRKKRIKGPGNFEESFEILMRGILSDYA